MIELPLRPFAVALHNVGLVTGDSDIAVLNKTVVIEVFDDHKAAVVASDGHGSILLRSVVNLTETPDPAIGDKPKQTIIAVSRHKLLSAFVTHALAVTKDDGAATDRRVTLDIREESDSSAQQSFDTMRRQVLSIEIDDMQAQLYLVEKDEFPDWRSAWPEADGGAAMREISFSPAHLAVFSKMKETRSAPRFKTYGEGQPVLVTVDGEPSVRGLVMPHAITEGQDEIDELRALWDLPVHGGEA